MSSGTSSNLETVVEPPTTNAAEPMKGRNVKSKLQRFAKILAIICVGLALAVALIGLIAYQVAQRQKALYREWRTRKRTEVQSRKAIDLPKVQVFQCQLQGGPFLNFSPGLNVQGRVKNGGSGTLMSITLGVAIYDESGTVIQDARPTASVVSHK